MKFSLDIEAVNFYIPVDYKESLSESFLNEYISDYKIFNMSTIEKRRLSTATKSILSLEFDYNLPIVFSTYKGEINRSLNLLEVLSKEHVTSPTSFSLSVLNASAASVSIFHKNHYDITAISSNPALENGLLQAYINLKSSNQHDKYLVLSYFEGENKEYLKDIPIIYVLGLIVKLGDSVEIESIPTDSNIHKDDHNITEINENILLSECSDIMFLKNFSNKSNYEFSSSTEKWRWTFK